MTKRKIPQKPLLSKPKSGKPKVFNPQRLCAICNRKKGEWFITLPFSFRNGKPFNYSICGWCNYRFLEAKEGKREQWRAKIKLRLAAFVLLSPDGKPFRSNFARQGAK